MNQSLSNETFLELARRPDRLLVRIHVDNRKDQGFVQIRTKPIVEAHIWSVFRREGKEILFGLVYEASHRDSLNKFAGLVKMTAYEDLEYGADSAKSLWRIGAWNNPESEICIYEDGREVARATSIVANGLIFAHVMRLVAILDFEISRNLESPLIEQIQNMRGRLDSLVDQKLHERERLAIF